MNKEELDHLVVTDDVKSDVVSGPAVGNDVSVRLGELGLTAAQTVLVQNLGVESLDDLVNLNEIDLVEIGVPKIKARKIIMAIRPTKSETTVADIAATSMNIDSILPSVPDDASWLSVLRASGIRKVDQSTVIASIRAALADRFGLYELPKRLIAEMESYVDATEEQVTDEFWTLRRQLTRKNYGDLFEAIDGLDGSYVTDARKSQLLGRIGENLWPALKVFNDVLNGWQSSWMQGAANPAMMMTAIASAVGGSGSGFGVPPGMMAPPDCGVIRDAAESLNDAVNRAFRGTGKAIAAALAYEANQIKTMMENPRLPSLCGMPSRELLIKKIGLAVPATYPRLEQNLTKYILGIMQSDRISSGPEELQYFGTLFMLGNQIPWGDLEEHSFRVNKSETKQPKGIGSSGSRPEKFLIEKGNYSSSM